MLWGLSREAAVTERQTIDILLAEDEDTDAFFFVQALETSAVSNKVHRVRDGQQAIDFLRRRGEYGNAPRPHIIFLDINMPRRDGYDVLHEIKADEGLRDIPVIIISGSSDRKDVRKSYSNYASAYVTKSKNLEGISELVEAVDSFWFRHAHLPQVV